METQSVGMVGGKEVTMGTGFACHCEHLSGSRALVTASGELDLHTCARFRKAIDDAARRSPAQLVFDFTRVTFMDSTALGVLAAEQRRREEPLHLVVREPQLLRILKVTGYEQVFVIHTSLEEAMLETGRRQAERARPV
jgi:anti-sigma B factor antagonist